ncbi:MAG: hypothetical protein H7255_16790, partial [Ramlibacter sp.]|nr:hypothetical protein [Ramlibacter sp.]
LGVQPDAPEVDPVVAESRVIQASIDVLGAIASPQRPVVIEVDDLQWAGAMTLRMFDRLMTAPALRGVMLVATYRNAEAEADPAAELPALLDRWRALAAPPLVVPLENLTSEAASELIGRTLRLVPERAEQLARSLHPLTGGNPFDTMEMLNVLRRDDALRLTAGGWQWEDAAISRFVGRSNVVDLLATRIGRLPAPTRHLLDMMSCMGASVEFALLEAATALDGDDHDEVALRHRLSPALDDGLLVLDAQAPNTLRFRHDRVQQAVLAMLDEAQRHAIALAMARRLATHADYRLEAAQYFVECVALLRDSDERRLAARVLDDAAANQADMADYALAERYLVAARAALAGLGDEPPDPADDALHLSVATKLHTALYTLGRTDDMDAVFADIQARVTNPIDLLEPVCQRIRVLDLRRDTAGALEIAVALLAQLGLQVPPEFDDAHTPARLDALADWVRADSRIEPGQRSQIRDPRLLAIARLLSRMTRSATYNKGGLRGLQWVILECLRMWTDHGPCADLLVGISRSAMMLIRSREDYRTGYEITRHVLEVGEALGFEPQTSEARANFSYLSCPWIEPLESAARQALRAYEGVRSGGDLIYSCFLRRAMTWLLLETAPDIDTCLADIAQGLALCQRVGNTTAEMMYRIERQAMRALAGLTNAPHSLDDAQFDEAVLLASFDRTPFAAVAYHGRKCFLSIILGDRHALAHHVHELVSVNGDELVFLEVNVALALSAVWQLQAGEGDTAALQGRLDVSWRWLQGRAAEQPYNFLHLERLLAGERAWAAGQTWEAAQLFDAAVAQARTRDRPWHRALIFERAGRFHLAKGLAQTGEL